MFKKTGRKTDPVFAGLHHKSLRFVSQRDPKSYTERIIGRDCVINIIDGQLVILSDNTEILRKPIASLRFAELMSHDGFTLETADGDMFIAYYTR